MQAANLSHILQGTALSHSETEVFIAADCNGMIKKSDLHSQIAWWESNWNYANWARLTSHSRTKATSTRVYPKIAICAPQIRSTDCIAFGTHTFSRDFLRHSTRVYSRTVAVYFGLSRLGVVFVKGLPDIWVIASSCLALVFRQAAIKTTKIDFIITLVIHNLYWHSTWLTQVLL